MKSDKYTNRNDSLRPSSRRNLTILQNWGSSERMTDEAQRQDLIFQLGEAVLRDIIGPHPYHLWVGMNGTEQARDDRTKKWRRVRPGAYLVALIGPVYKALKHGREAVSQALDDLPLPEDCDTMSEASLWKLHYFEQASRCVSLLIPSLAIKERWAEGPGIAKRLLAEREGRALPQKDPLDPVALVSARPLSFWLSLAWRRSYPIVDFRGGVFGFTVQAHDLWTAALAEGLLLILFNIRKLRFCPHCYTLHWEKHHSVCKECRRAQDRQRKARRPKTDIVRFRNRVAQAKCRGRLTEEQAGQILATLEKHGLPAAEGLYMQLKRLSGNHAQSRSRHTA